MKLKLAIASAIIALNVSSQAAVYTVSNVGDGLTDVLIQDGKNLDNTVRLLDGGVVALGYFAAGYSFPAAAADAVSSFTLVTSALAGSPSDTLSGSFKGYVEAATFQGSAITSTLNTALVGRALYVFAGNASTLAGSTRFGLQQVATLALDEPLEQSYSVTLSGAPAPIYGTVGSYTGDAGGQGSSTYATLNLVPETSSALLGAMGALGLLRRRRN